MKIRLLRRGHWLRRSGGVAALATVFALAIATPAFAHPYLLSSDPASGAVLTAAPAQIDINYTEGLDRSYCQVVLVAPNGAKIQTHQVSASQPTELAIAPDQSLSAQGTYVVDWTAVGDDGHTVIGTFGFSIGHATRNAALANTTGPQIGSSSSPAGVQRMLRTVLPLLIVVLAGALLLAGQLGGAGRRSRTFIRIVYGVELAAVVALAIDVVANGGWSAFGRSTTGQRLIAELALSLLAGIGVLRFASDRVTRSVGAASALGLLFVLALSGHAATQPHSRRDLAIAVYTAHLIAVSIWIAAIAAVALRIGQPTPADGRTPMRALRPLVAVSLVAVLGTGLATTDWGLRTLSDATGTTWGKLAIVLIGLFLVIAWLGVTGALFAKTQRVRNYLIGIEATVAAGALIVAGVLGQIAEPLDQPYASQIFAADAGLPLAVAPIGSDSLVVSTLSPGVVGHNALNVEVGDADEDDFLHPAPNVRSVVATAECGCGQPSKSLVLHASGDGSEWTTDVDLPTAATWVVQAEIALAGKPAPKQVQLSERVTEANLPHQVVVGVPAALSGADGQECRDEVLGLQVAFNDLNSTAADHGDLVRVEAVDLQDGSSAAVDQLHAAGARVIAMPCGTSEQVNSAVTAARAVGLPVVLGNGTSQTVGDGVWSTQPAWTAEGGAVATQAATQTATSITAVVGDTAVDREELAGLKTEAAKRGEPVRVMALPADAKSWAAGLPRDNVDLLALLADPDEALPIVHALSDLAADWLPPRGILASSQLMSTDFINDAGTITRQGGIEFASNINPFDPVAQYYAERLRTLEPGVRPSFNGLYGYEAGVAIAQALKDGGGAPSAARLTTILSSKFAHFSVGSYQLGWTADGGTTSALSFFRSTYVNPMAMPDFAPGGASSLAHEGTFLDTGGFEQVAPFRQLGVTG